MLLYNLLYLIIYAVYRYFYCQDTCLISNYCVNKWVLFLYRIKTNLVPKKNIEIEFKQIKYIFLFYVKLLNLLFNYLRLHYIDVS